MNQQPFAKVSMESKETATTPPALFMSRRPSRFASMASRVSSSTETSRTCAQKVWKSPEPRIPRKYPKRSATAATKGVGWIRCRIFRPRPFRWPDCVHDEDVFRTTLSSVLSLNRSPTCRFRASVICWRASSSPGCIRNTGSAVIRSSGSLAAAGRRPTQVRQPVDQRMMPIGTLARVRMIFSKWGSKALRT